MENNVLKKLFKAAGIVLLSICCQLSVAAPVVSISATPNNPVAPANVTLAVTATNDGAQVMATQVEYFNGTASLGVAAQAPFTLTLNDMAAGTYQITAKATTTDPNYPTVQSAPLALTVGSAPGAATAYFIHTDQLNTPRAITDGSGNLVWQWDSDPFGKDAANEQPTGQPAFTFNQRLPGQQFDRESNLHYNYFRDYDPVLGRYIQSDPIGLEGGVNTYAYVEGDPLGKTDFYGLQSDGTKIYVPCPPWGCLGLPKAADPVSGAPISNVMDEDRGRGRESSSSSRSRDRTRDCPPDKEECERQWREARLQCRARIYEQMEQAAGRRKKRSVKGVTGGYTDVEECARGLVSEECGGNKKRY